MTSQPIVPVIPSPGRLAGTPRVAPPAVRPLPMAGPTAALSVPAGVVYGIGRIDASGRVTDRAIACALGWREGDRLTLTAEPGVVTARRDPGGMVTVRARACLAIPAVLRRRCGLRAGDRVLLAAVPGQGDLRGCLRGLADDAAPHVLEDLDEGDAVRVDPLLGGQPHDDPGQAAAHRQVRPRPPGGPARVRCPQDFLRAALERLDLPEDTFAFPALMVEGRER